MTTIKTPGNKCLECGYKYECASGIFEAEGMKPREGDISVCLNCGAAAIFNADLSLRLPTAKEKAAITMSKEVLEYQITRASVVNEDLRKRQHERT